jgi:hypothetical protein
MSKWIAQAAAAIKSRGMYKDDVERRDAKKREEEANGEAKATTSKTAVNPDPDAVKGCSLAIDRTRLSAEYHPSTDPEVRSLLKLPD